MKALITGGGGFLGSHIVAQLLARGDNVTVFTRGYYADLIGMGANLIQGDLQDSEAVNLACRGMDAVFHVAAKAGYWGTWDSFYRPNVIGTEHIIAACKKQRVPKLIYTSTPSVVANGSDRCGANESLPYPSHFETYYAHTKALAEQQVTAANGPDLLTVSLRPHIIFGPKDTQIIPRLLARAKAGKLVQVGSGQNRVDMTYIDDAARAHLLAADALSTGAAAAGSVYFISQVEPVVLWSWVSNLLVALKLPPIKRTISLPLARGLGRLMEMAYTALPLSGEPRLTRFLADELALNHYYDISRAEQDLGYRPGINMAQATQQTIDDLRLTLNYNDGL